MTKASPNSLVTANVVLGLCVTFFGVTTTFAAAPDSKRATNGASPQTQAYIGLGVESLHPSLFNHLEDQLSDGSGLLVVDVAPGSPADHADIKPHDILTKYDDQRLYSPLQLAHLVHHDRSGREVSIGVLRAGKPLQLKVSLGNQPTDAELHAPPRPTPPNADSGSNAAQAGTAGRRTDSAAPDEESRWGTFDSMTLTRKKDDRFNAEIKFRDRQGKIESKTFEGTRDEIRQAIQREKNLPAGERDDLMNTLSNPVRMPLPWMDWFPEPLFDNDRIGIF